MDWLMQIIRGLLFVTFEGAENGFSGLRHYGHQFIGFLKQRCNEGGGHHFVLYDYFNPEGAFVGFFNYDSKSCRKFSWGACPANRPVVCPNRCAGSNQLPFNGASFDRVWKSIYQLQNSQGKLFRAPF